MNEKMNGYKNQMIDLKNKVITYCKENKQHVIIGEVVLALALGVMIYVIALGRNWNAERILTEFMKAKPDITAVEVQEDELALDNIKSRAYFNDILIKNDTFAGCIEVFDNKQDALLRKEYLEALYTQTSQLISQDNFGKAIMSEYGILKPSLYINGNVLLRLDGAYSKYQTEQMVKAFNQVLENDMQTEKNIPNKEAIEAAKEKNLERAKTSASKAKENLVVTLEKSLVELEAKLEKADINGLLDIIDIATSYLEVVDLKDRATSLVDSANAKIQAEADKIDEALNEAENELDQELLDAAKKLMEKLTHTVFDEYRDDWTERVTQIQWAINDKIIRDYKDQCVAYEYDDIMYDIDSYIDEYAYFRGKVVEVTQTDSGLVLRVNVTPVYAFFSDKILYWEDSVYVELDSECSLDVRKDQLVELWGQIQGTTTLSSNFGGSQTSLDFYARYAEVN